MDANDKEIIEAATTANVHSFISKLPNEYLTEVLFHYYGHFFILGVIVGIKKMTRALIPH